MSAGDYFSAFGVMSRSPLPSWTAVSVFWIVVVLILVSLVALTFVLDHYDRPFNERFYVRLRRVMLGATALIALVGVCTAYQQIWRR